MSINLGELHLLGGSKLLIDKDLTIDAAALSHGVTLDGNQESRVFLIAGDVSVFLSGLKIGGFNFLTHR